MDALTIFQLLQVLERGEHTMVVAERDLKGVGTGVKACDPLPTRWPCGVTFHATGSAPEDIPFSVFGWWLFSDRLKRLIESEQLHGITFLPVEVVNDLPSPIQRYWYAHFECIAGALDRERSTVAYYGPDRSGPGPRLNVIKPVLHHEQACSQDFFRLKEYWPTVFTSGRFRDLCMRERISGASFRVVPLV
ncbi:MAG: DUF1629 domain-containing protein [Phycisphaerae bacterium]|nr:DUF1629 domain-containing protein [Phycisphaerae bacterium]